MNRTEIIQHYIDSRKAKSYLEIGCFRNENFNKIKVEHKESVDPDPEAMATHQMTSDAYFNSSFDKFDVIFIDGLHEHTQVLRDVGNALMHLNPKGVIIMHDCMPKNEKMQVWDNKSHQDEEWTGDTWKAYYKAYKELPHKVYVISEDYGCGVIDTAIEVESKHQEFVNMDELTYKDYLKFTSEGDYGEIRFNDNL